MSLPSTDRTGRRMRVASSAPNLHRARPGSSTPKAVSASLTAWATVPGTLSSSTARHASHSMPLMKERNAASAPS